MIYSTMYMIWIILALKQTEQKRRKKKETKNKKCICKPLTFDYNI